MDRSQIDIYAAGGTELVQAYWGLSNQQLHARPADGSWTLHQIAIHLLDSDLIGTDRLKRIASMEKPLLVGYDETGFVNLPGSHQINAFSAIDIFQKNRIHTAMILKSLPDASFQRTGIHTESGLITLEQLLQKYIHHLQHHLVFVSKKRKIFDDREKVIDGVERLGS